MPSFTPSALREQHDSWTINTVEEITDKESKLWYFEINDVVHLMHYMPDNEKSRGKILLNKILEISAFQS